MIQKFMELDKQKQVRMPIDRCPEARTSHPTSIGAKKIASKQSFQSIDSWCFMLKVQWEFLMSAKHSPMKIRIGKKKHQHSPNQPLIRQPTKMMFS